jgi:hypothetical protein
VELPDGKVLSGTERGNLLLWDAHFIKREISRRNQQPCHDGPVEVVFLEDSKTTGIANSLMATSQAPSTSIASSILPSVASMLGAQVANTITMASATHQLQTVSSAITASYQIITAGHDGYVRIWDFEALDSAIVSDSTQEARFLELEPIKEIKIGDGVNVSYSRVIHW